jgi:hypothetical protein
MPKKVFFIFYVKKQIRDILNKKSSQKTKQLAFHSY